VLSAAQEAVLLAPVMLVSVVRAPVLVQVVLVAQVVLMLVPLACP